MLYYDIVVKPSQGLQNWTLNALTCLVLACKFQERDDFVPLIEDMIKSLVNSSQFAPSTRLTARSNQAITYEAVTKTEVEFIQKLEWSLHRVTVWAFLENYSC